MRAAARLALVRSRWSLIFVKNNTIYDVGSITGPAPMDAKTNYEDVNTPVIFAIGFLAVVVLIAVVLFCQVLYYQTKEQMDVEKDINQPFVELSNLQSEQEGKLASYAWDAKTKTASIPIDRAMDLVLAELTRPEPAGKKAGEKGVKHEKR